MRDRRLLDFRRAVTAVINVLFVSGLAGALTVTVLVDTSGLDLSAWVGVACGVAATVGGLFASVYFLTAQVGTNGLRGYGLSDLYRSPELFLLLAAIVVSLLAGLLVAAGSDLLGSWRTAFAVLCVVVCSYVVMIIVPVGLIQIENMSYSMVALKFTRGVRGGDIARWRIAEITVGDNDVSARLANHRFDYGRRDPLRSVHDIVETAAAQRDPHLIGQVAGLLCGRIAHEYGWPGPDGYVFRPAWTNIRRPLVRFRRDHTALVAIHVLHYLRRLAPNLRRNWEGWDSGRHGVQFQLARMVSALALSAADPAVIRWTLFAILHISIDYREVVPYGRVEPLAALFRAANDLEAEGRSAEADLAAGVLAVVERRTTQIDTGRLTEAERSLPSRVQAVFDVAYRHARRRDWQPGLPGDDPWA